MSDKTMTLAGLIEQLEKDASARKEAGPIADGQGAPVVQSTPAAPLPIPGEEGVGNPGQKAQERGNANPADEAMGDDVAAQRMKVEEELMAQMGADIAARSRMDEEEQVSSSLKPQSPELASADVAPAGGGPGTLGEGALGDIAASAAKMSSDLASAFLQEYETEKAAALHAKERRDVDGYTEHAKQANLYLKLAQKHQKGGEEAQKQAAAGAALESVLAKIRGEAPKQADAPAAGNGAANGAGQAKEAEVDDDTAKLAGEYVASGQFAGEGIRSVIEPVLDEKIAAIDERIAKVEAFFEALEPKLAEALANVLQKAAQ